MKASSADPAPVPTMLQVRQARGFLERARGLLACPVVAPGCGLLLLGVNAVHGFGMRRAIDLVFLDDQGVVVRCKRLSPWRVAGCRAARHVLEMRAGEAARLQLRAGARPDLQPVADIFRQPGGSGDPPAGPGDCGASVPRAARSPRSPRARMRLLPWMLASAALALAQDAPSEESAPAAPSAATQSAAAPPAAGRLLAVPTARNPTMDTTTMRRFEAEADTLYRDSAPHVADAELVRLYEALAGAAPDRRAHAWLRIGNIHQRAGSVGAAMDAYRKALGEAAADVQQGDAAESRRKALLNLASLALDQAGQALAGLAPPGAAVHLEQLEALSRQLDRAAPGLRLQPQPATQRPQAQPQSAASPPGLASRDAPYVVERYTASGRRNAVKAAKGSLHAAPDDELPARPVAKPRSRAPERLPEVEYLLGDPQRSQAASDGGDGGAPAARRKRDATGGKQ